jgi:hypothetical protein
MDNVSEEIHKLITEKNVKGLLVYDTYSIQVYFDLICNDENNLTNVNLLLLLFKEIDIVNALFHSYRNHLSKLFRILCENVSPDFTDKNKDFVIKLLEDSYNGNPEKFVKIDMLQLLIENKVCTNNELFLISITIHDYNLTNLLFNCTDNDTKVKAFRESYRNGNYIAFQLLYNYIKEKRIAINEDLGYSPSGEIISSIGFQEYYNWKTLLIDSVKYNNYWVLESLIKKMPSCYELPFGTIGVLASFAPDSVLQSVCAKFIIKELNAEFILRYRRTPLITHLQSRTMPSDWHIVKE